MAGNIWQILGAVVELTNIFLCYTQILQAELNTKKGRLLIAYGGIILCTYINVIGGMGIEQSAINMLYCLLIPMLVMKNTKLKWVLLYPCAFMISSIISIAISFIIAIILEIPQAYMSEIESVSALVNSMSSIMLGIVCIYRVIKRKTGKRNLFLNNAIYISVTIGTIVFYLLIGLVQYIGLRYAIPAIQTNLLGLFLSIVCIVFFAFFLWLSSTVYNNQMYQRERDMLNLHLAEQEKYIQLIVDKNNDMRRFRHDVKEHMWIISQYIEQSKFDEARKYIDIMYGKLNASDMEIYTGILALDAVISDKKRDMGEKGIAFKWRGSNNKLPDSFEVYDLCTLFINILNNAVEACEVLEQTDRVVELVVEVNSGKLYIRENNKTYNQDRKSVV